MVSVTKHIRLFLRLFPESERAEVRKSLRDLKFPAARLALECGQAESAGLSYADAIQREMDFPLMARVQFGVIDLLQLELPAEAQRVIRRTISRGREVDRSAIRAALFDLASRDAGPSSALARFLIYQGIRLNVWAATYDDNGGIEACGGLDHVDELAERLLDRELRAWSPTDVADPMRLLVVQSLLELEKFIANRNHELLQESRDGVALVNRLAGALRLARTLSAPDAVLIRNELARHATGHALGAKRLVERHPVAFPSEAALYQRRARLPAKLGSGGTPKTRLIDLILEESNR